MMSACFAAAALSDRWSWLKGLLPDWLIYRHVLGVFLWQWGGLLLLIIVAFLIAGVLQRIGFPLAKWLFRHAPPQWHQKFFKLLPGLVRVILTVLLVEIGHRFLDIQDEPKFAIHVAVRSIMIIVLTWGLLQIINLSSDLIEEHLISRLTALSQRQAIRTQVAVPRVILRFLVFLLGGALLFLQFDVVRHVGYSMLASAGLAGVVLGFAAQETVSNMLAGIQLAVFQPFAIGDSVVVEGEWGWIEEVSLTYVLIKIWDQRRLVLPVSYFMNKPFQNWTKIEPELLGTVFVYTNYGVDLEEMRAELRRIMEATDLWDGKVQLIQVTNLTDHTMELRVLISARDGPVLWDLRCYVREKLVAWLGSQDRAYLPYYRVEMNPDATPRSPHDGA
jgi:small-conductance mechanosensitive channel